MNSVQECLHALASRVMGNPELGKEIDCTYLLELSGQGGGSYRLNTRPPASLSKEAGPSDCTISLSGEDFIAIVTGKLNPQAAFLSGRLKVSQNVARALPFVRLLS